MKLFLFGLALFVFTLSLAARAEETAPEETKVDKEALSLALCQPAQFASSAFSAQDKREALKLHREFAAFLRNPAPTVRELEKAADSTDISEQLGLMLGYAFTCGHFDTFGDLIASRGCADERGRQLDTSKARALCAPLAEKIRNN